MGKKLLRIQRQLLMAFELAEQQYLHTGSRTKRFIIRAGIIYRIRNNETQASAGH